METFETDMRVALPVFTTQKMLDKSESLQNAVGRLSKGPNTNPSLILQTAIDKPLTDLLFKDQKYHHTQLRIKNHLQYPSTTKHDTQKPYQTTLNTVDDEIGGVVATLFDRSIIQTEPQMFQSLVHHTQNSNNNKVMHRKLGL